VRRGFFKSYVNSDCSAFAPQGSGDVADVAGFDVAAFDLNDDAFCFARIVVNKTLMPSMPLSEPFLPVGPTLELTGRAFNASSTEYCG